MKKFILPALIAAVFGVSLMAAAGPGETKGDKKECACCKDCKDPKAKDAKSAKTPKPEAPKA